MQPRIHLIDETWIDAPADAVANEVATPGMWRMWWPTLSLTVTRDRGLKGQQWTAGGQAPSHRFRRARPLTGTVEIWLEPMRGGVLLHHYLRLDPVGEQLSRRASERITRDFAWHAKRQFWQLKDRLEAGR
jgi:hypothetical protein